MNIDEFEKSVKKSRFFVAVLFVITIAGYFIWFFAIQNQSLSTDSSVWGTFGDFVGGLLNPLIAYSAFYWLTVSVIVQKQELAETKQALIDSSKAQEEQVKQYKIQRFENTFFNMLSLQNEILNTVVFNSKSISPLNNPEDESSASRSAFSSILRWIDSEDGNEEGQFSTLNNYDLFQVQANQVVGHYYRNFYQIIKFIGDSGLCDDDKEKYARILRAQLSSDEIAVLFFNCLSPKVDSGQFKSFVITYKMLEHLTVEAFFNVGFARISTQSVYVPEDFFEQYVVRDTDGNVIESAFGTNQALEKFAIKKI